MKQMPKDLKIVLIGTHNGRRDDRTILAEARAFGIGPDRIDLRRSVPHDEVRDTFVRSRCSLIFSLREGSCMAIVESMFAGTPVGMFDNAKVGSRKFINDQTGRFLSHKNLAPQLMDFLKHSGDYDPRGWVERNKVDCFGSSATLNEVIRKKCLADGDEWTRDTFPHHWSPHPELTDRANYEQVRADYDHIQNEIGIDLDGFPGDKR